jgi:hypothetical protein
MIRVTKDLMLAVREMFERTHDVIDIAHRMNLDPADVQMILNLITNIVQ